MITERSTATAELANTPELSPEAVSNLFSVVGNSEWKGIFLPQMGQGVEYSTRAIYFLVNRLQGEEGQTHISENKVAKHLKKLVGMGILERDEDKTYRLTRFGFSVVVPFVGHVLSFSECHPGVGLEQLFGSSKSTAKEREIDTFWGKQPYRKTAQITRLKIIDALSRISTIPFRETDLANLIGEKRGLVGTHLESLSRNGIIDSRSVAADSSYAMFKLSKDRPKAWPRAILRAGVVRTRDAYGVFLEHFEGCLSASDVVLFLEEQSGKAWPKEGKAKATSNLRHWVLPRLVNEGYIVYADNFKRGVLSEIALNPNQRSLIADAAELVQTVVRIDDFTLEAGRRKAWEITSVPRKVASLVRKSGEFSANNDWEARLFNKDRIAGIVRRLPGITVRGVALLLARDHDRKVSFRVVRNHLEGLERRDKVEGIKFPGKKAKQWYPK